MWISVWPSWNVTVRHSLGPQMRAALNFPAAAVGISRHSATAARIRIKRLIGTSGLGLSPLIQAGECGGSLSGWEPIARARWTRGAVGDRPLSEGRLIVRARDGDQRAYRELVEQNQTIAFRVAWAITGSAADAEDAAQDGFLKAFGALPRFRDGAPFRPWLLRIVANEAHNRRASTERRGRLALRMAGERRADAVPSPEAALLDSERRDRLLAAVSRLG